MTLLEEKMFKPKFKEGGLPCLKGLARTLVVFTAVCMYLILLYTHMENNHPLVSLSRLVSLCAGYYLIHHD